MCAITVILVSAKQNNLMRFFPLLLFISVLSVRAPTALSDVGAGCQRVTLLLKHK